MVINVLLHILNDIIGLGPGEIGRNVCVEHASQVAIRACNTVLIIALVCNGVTKVSYKVATIDCIMIML